MATEPLVRIRCADPEDEARCRRALGAAGLSPETSLLRLIVRDADPDHVHRTLVAAGAVGRVVVRQRIGMLIGWLIDRQGALEGRARNIKALVERVLGDGGLADRYAPGEDEQLLSAGRRLYERLMAESAPFVSWEDFLELFTVSRPAR